MGSEDQSETDDRAHIVQKWQQQDENDDAAEPWYSAHEEAEQRAP
jgi:redox-sensitive bicupin YhaK (pirin superfamily)